MSDGIFSPMLRDLLIFVCLTVSILAFVFAAYAWTMMQDGQKKYIRMQSFMDEYDKMKERMKDVETRLRKEEIKLKATMAANRLGKAGLIPTLKEGEDMDVEELDVPEWKGKFDYILAGDVLEHLKNPWEMVAKLRKLLRPEGRLIASLPNVMFFGNVFNLLSGEWKYGDAGILDRTHLRFFTRRSIERMLLEAGFAVENIQALRLTMSESDKNYVLDILKAFRMSGISMADDEQFMAYQWLVVAQNTERETNGSAE